jgi:hypothetical protein
LSSPQRLKPLVTFQIHRGAEALRYPKPLDAHCIVSHPNVAKSATLGWGTLSLPIHRGAEALRSIQNPSMHAASFAA